MSASIVKQSSSLASSPPVGSFDDYIESLERKSLNLSPVPSISSIASNNQPSFRSAFDDQAFGDSFGSGSHNNNNSFNNPAWVAARPAADAGNVDGGGNDNNNTANRPLTRVDSFIVWNEQLSRDNFDYTYHDDPNWSAEKELEQQQQLSSSADHRLNNSGDNMNMVKKRGLFSRSGGGGMSLHSKSMASTSGGAIDRMSGDSNSGNGKSALPSGSAMTDADEDKFNGEGVLFVGKLIGTEYVADARGEQMCQQSLKKLKILKKAAGGHKQKINMFISFDGIKIYDSLMVDQLYHHTVPQISFISRDETDPRAFGYVFGNSTTGHQFIGIKTKKEAMLVMSTIGQLFAITLKRKRAAEKEEATALYEDEHNQAQMVAMGDEPHFYHDINGGGGTYYNQAAPLTTSMVVPIGSIGSSGRSRRTRNISGSSESVPIPALPAPLNDSGRRHHHHQSNLSLPPPPSKHSMASSSNTLKGVRAAGARSRPGFDSDCQSATSFDKKEPSAFSVPFGQPQQQQPQWVGFDTFGQTLPDNNVSAPIRLVTAAQPTTTTTSKPSNWANFDDDDNNMTSLYQNVPSQADDTLNTISSISEVNISNVSTLASTAAANRTITASNDSNTLVARYKCSAKNGSQSTIASSNFDGVDPFSDVFGEDPFNASTAGVVAGPELSASFASMGTAPKATASTEPLAASTGNLYPHAGGSFPPAPGASSNSMSNFNLNASGQFANVTNNNASFRSDTSKQSTSSADRYAALADIQSISTSIFDAFGDKSASAAAAPAAGNETEDRSASRISNKSIGSANVAGGAASVNLFDRTSMGSQASTFQTANSGASSSSNLFHANFEQQPQQQQQPGDLFSAGQQGYQSSFTMPSQQQQQQQLQQPGAAAALNWSTNSLPTFGGGAFAPNVEQQQQQTSSSANLFHDIDPIGGNKKPASFLSDRPAMFVEQKQRQQLTSSTSGLYGVSPSNSVDTEQSSKQASSPAPSSATSSPVSLRRPTTSTTPSTATVVAAAAAAADNNNNNASLTTPPTQTGPYTRLTSSGIGSSPSPSGYSARSGDTPGGGAATKEGDGKTEDEDEGAVSGGEHREMQSSHRSTSSTSLLNEDEEDVEEQSNLHKKEEKTIEKVVEEDEDDHEEERKREDEQQQRTGPPSISSLASTSLNLSKFETSFDEVFAGDLGGSSDQAAKAATAEQQATLKRVSNRPEAAGPSLVRTLSRDSSVSNSSRDPPPPLPPASSTPPLPPRTDLCSASSSRDPKYRYSNLGSALPPPPPYSKPTPQPPTYHLSGYPYYAPPYGAPPPPPPNIDPYGTCRAYTDRPPSALSASGASSAPRMIAPLPPPPPPLPPTSDAAAAGGTMPRGGGSASAYDYLYDVPSSIPMAPPPSYYGLTPPPHYAYHDVYYRQYYAEQAAAAAAAAALYGPPPHWPPMPPPSMDYYVAPSLPPHYPPPPAMSMYDTLPMKPRQVQGAGASAPPGTSTAAPLDGVSRPGSSVSQQSHPTTASLPPPLPLPQRRISATSLQDRPYPMSSFLVGRSNSSASTAPPTVETTPRTPPTMAAYAGQQQQQQAYEQEAQLAFHYPPPPMMATTTLGRHSKMSSETQPPPSVGSSYLASFNAHMKMLNQQYQQQQQQEEGQAAYYAEQQQQQQVDVHQPSQPLLADFGDNASQWPGNGEQQQQTTAPATTTTTTTNAASLDQMLFDDNFGSENIPPPSFAEAKKLPEGETVPTSSSSSPSKKEGDDGEEEDDDAGGGGGSTNGSSTLKDTNNNSSNSSSTNNNGNNHHQDPKMTNAQPPPATTVDIFKQAAADEDPFANDPFFQS